MFTVLRFRVLGLLGFLGFRDLRVTGFGYRHSFRDFGCGGLGVV